jgi:3-hydroxyisobutyrate dehydrogenase
VTDPVIGFIGLGNMGAVMAARLLAAGYTVHGFDLSPAALDAFAALRGQVHESLDGVAREAEVIILMLPDSGTVEAVVRDPAFTPRAGTLIVDMSSSEPLRTQSLARELAARGLLFADAPVSGGVGGARAGTLAIMAGGEDAVLDRVDPVFAVLGSPVRVGPIGSGHALKALNNLLSATHLLVTAEAMAVGERFGLRPEVMLEVFNNSSGMSGSTKNKWPKFVLSGTYDSGFGLRLMLKDVRIAVNLADQVGAEHSLGSESAALWEQAADKLPPAADHTEIARWVMNLAGQGNPVDSEEF